MEPGRNQPCPCGSGRKYKQCHLGRWSDWLEQGDLWSQVHEASLRLPTAILRFAVTSYGRGVVDLAWRRFSGSPTSHLEPDTPETPIFVPWCVYQWVPGPEVRDSREAEGLTLAARYLLRRSREQGPLALRYLAASTEAVFSFHDVVQVEPGTGLTLRDALTGAEAKVVEKTASQSARPGEILLARVATLDGLSIIDGCAPIGFPPLEKAGIIELRKRIRPGRRAISVETVREHELDLFATYRQIADRLLHPRPPVMQNTDGEPLVFARVSFEVPSARSAFDVLAPLSIDTRPADLLREATFDAHGELLAVEFPWLRNGGPALLGSFTTLGRVMIDGQRVVVEVNSEERAQRIRKIADERLPDGSRHLATVLESLESALERSRARGPSADAEREDLNSHPEVQKLLAERMRAHYREWPSMPLPALNGRTPLQAMRSREGREMVEALLLDFEQHIDQGPGMTREILAELRSQLAGAGSGRHNQPRQPPTA
ncbi:MAG: SEC-C metal-binding domain-containing protein [Candidatus Dormiibacterota bacterium]